MINISENYILMMPVLSREINGKYVTEPCSNDALNMISWFAQGYTRNKISGFYRRTSQFFVLSLFFLRLAGNVVD